MAASRIEPIIQHLRRVVLREDKTGKTDGQLLEDFIFHRDGTAFETLIRRHGPMVLGVCRRILGNPHDAEDCFQATFLVLARKAGSVSPREQVGNWLYGVARTTAVRSKATNAKRRRRERQVIDMPEPEAVRQDLRDDVQPLLDEELARLPDKYRQPVVLCDLEGRPRREVARQLKIPDGTLSSRLTTARRMLAKRLARRGLAVTLGSLTAMLAHRAAAGCVPVSLVSSTVKAAVLIGTGDAAAGVLSVKVAALAEGVVKTMFVNKILKSSALVLLASGLALGLGSFGAGLRNDSTLAAAQSEGERDSPKELSPTGTTKSKTDLQQLQGTWQVVSCVQDGVNDGSAGEWIFRDRTIRIETNPKAMTHRGMLIGFDTAFLAKSLRLPEKRAGITGFNEFFRFRLDLTRTPKRIDLGRCEKDFEDKGEVFEGVYALDGDTLRVCLGGVKENGKMDNRPTVLESKKGSEAILVTLKRKTKTGEKRDQASSAATTPKTEEKRDRTSSGSMPKTEETLREVKLGQKAEDYNTIFDSILDLVDDFFEVAYANRFEGRIETYPLSEKPIRRRAVILIVAEDEGGYRVSVRVEKEVETPTAKTDEKNPPLPATPSEIAEKSLSPRSEKNWTPVGRDAELEQIILRRFVEQERKRQSERPHEPAEHEMPRREHPNSILLRDVHVDVVGPNRTISVTSLSGRPTKIMGLPVAIDAKIKVKRGNVFRNLKVGMRLILELSVENNQMVVTEIRQVGM